MVVNELNTATNLFKGDISYDGESGTGVHPHNISSALCQKGLNSVLPYARRALTLWDSHWVKALLA